MINHPIRVSPSPFSTGFPSFSLTRPHRHHRFHLTAWLSVLPPEPRMINNPWSGISCIYIADANVTICFAHRLAHSRLHRTVHFRSAQFGRTGTDFQNPFNPCRSPPLIFISSSTRRFANSPGRTSAEGQLIQINFFHRSNSIKLLVSGVIDSSYTSLSAWLCGGFLEKVQWNYCRWASLKCFKEALQPPDAKPVAVVSLFFVRHIVKKFVQFLL
jgi:hypothetical protein